MDSSNFRDMKIRKEWSADYKYYKPYAIKTNNIIDSYITRDRDCFFQESLSWSGDFQQNANKDDLIL